MSDGTTKEDKVKYSLPLIVVPKFYIMLRSYRNG